MFNFIRVSTNKDKGNAWASLYFSDLSSPIESFLEEHIEASNHYVIQSDGVDIGLAAVHGGSLLTMCYLAREHRRLGQQMFAAVRKLESVREVFVPTCDEHLMSLVLDCCREIKPQAYFFQEVDVAAELDCLIDGFSLRVATLDDVGLIVAESGDFLDPVAERIGRGELFVGLVGETPVSFGIMERSRIVDDVTSIGMFVLEAQRQRGYGTETLRGLRRVCRVNGWRAVAGCFYYNHNSKKTLERAGMFSQTRLMRAQL